MSSEVYRHSLPHLVGYGSHVRVLSNLIVSKVYVRFANIQHSGVYQYVFTGELGYDGPLYDGLLSDDMLGPSPMHMKSVLCELSILCRPLTESSCFWISVSNTLHVWVGIYVELNHANSYTWWFVVSCIL